MSLLAISDVPDSPETLDRWSFNYMAWIRDNNRVILQNYQAQLPEYVLDPIPPDTGVWLYQNQQWHNARNAVLGINGNDLTSVDFNDPDQLSAWVFLIFTEEQQAGAKLGLG